MDRAELGIAEDVVAAVRREIEALGFVPKELPAASPGLVVGTAADVLFEEASEFLLDSALGISLAGRVPIGGLGALDYGLVTSATLRDALNLLTRYYSIATQRVRLELEEGSDRSAVVGTRLPNIHHSRHWIEFSFAVFASRIRQTLSREDITFDIAFKHPAPPTRGQAEEHFRGSVQFDAPQDRLTFATEHLGLALHTASKPLAELLERRMKEIAPERAIDDPVLDRVRRTLGQMLEAGETDVKTLAARLSESTRTLQRTLGQRNTSHSQLLDELRRQRAQELLDAGLRVADVAQRLGFAAPSAFFRAYRRWTGTSPRGRDAQDIEEDAKSASDAADSSDSADSE
ncbi:MAG TPA: AraC family transcriptional regulator ligand-binding domain-containing protein [Kofleriaceae bacterium]